MRLRVRSEFSTVLLSMVALASVGCSAAGSARSDEATKNVTQAVTGPFQWKGYTWNPTTGAMAGVAPGDPSNVLIDANGYLHLKITKTGTTWTAAEVFTTTNLGFGTYQWQIAGPIDRMDHTVVLGLFPYGPQAGIGADGTNEIDTEFSFWNDELPNVNADWTVYPPTKAGTVWEDDFGFSLNGGSSATARMTWSSTAIIGTLMSGFQTIGASNGVIRSRTYSPSNSATQIPQVAMPLGMNLWCYKAVPASGQNVEVVIQDFQFVPEGSSSGSGSGSSGSLASSGGSAGASGGSPSGSSGASAGISSGSGSSGGAGSPSGASGASAGTVSAGAPSGGSGGAGSGSSSAAAIAGSPSGGSSGGAGSSGVGLPSSGASSGLPVGVDASAGTAATPTGAGGAGCGLAAGAGAGASASRWMSLAGLLVAAGAVAARRKSRSRASSA